MPEALISRITSRGPGVGSGKSLSSSLRSPRNTTPFMALLREGYPRARFCQILGLRGASHDAPGATQRCPGSMAMTVYEIRTYTLRLFNATATTEIYTE